MNKIFKKIDWVFHLAGLADIVPSIENPDKYFQVNVNGTLNVLEASKKNNIKKFIYAASKQVAMGHSQLFRQMKKIKL